MDGEDVYVFFENGNEERPVIHSYVSHGEGSANYYSSWLSDIPNYNANKTYGLALACPAHYEYYWGLVV